MEMTKENFDKLVFIDGWMHKEGSESDAEFIYLSSYLPPYNSDYDKKYIMLSVYTYPDRYDVKVYYKNGDSINLPCKTENEAYKMLYYFIYDPDMLNFTIDEEKVTEEEFAESENNIRQNLERIQTNKIVVDDIIKELSIIYPDLRVKDYRKQFNMLYGDTFLLNNMDDEIKANIVCIEKNRLSDNRQNYNISPKEFVKQYSKISFFLAKECYFKQTPYLVAIFLNNIFSDFIEDGNLDWLEKRLLKNIISETISDLEYASEISTLYSSRMKSLIQQNKNS